MKSETTTVPLNLKSPLRYRKTFALQVPTCFLQFTASVALAVLPSRNAKNQSQQPGNRCSKKPHRKFEFSDRTVPAELARTHMFQSVPCLPLLEDQR